MESGIKIASFPQDGPSLNELRRLANIVKNRFGIVIGEDKQILVANRLRNYLLQRGFKSYQELLNRLEANPEGIEYDDLADLLSTNYTFFYRESDHFDLLRTRVLPEIEAILKAQKSNDLRVWCCASSTGEEAYTIGMLLMEHFGSRYSRIDAGVLATDISSQALRQGEVGRYHASQLLQLPPALMNKYFVKINHDTYDIIPTLKKEVLFRKFNLLSRHFPFRKPFHVIFCRNVMIYFDRETRSHLLSKLYDITVPGGYLFIGHAECIGSEKMRYERISPTILHRGKNR
jgi:chemotaxis protein methyltransferase CheR